MNRLQSEFERLFRAPDAAADDIALVDDDGRVVTLLIRIARSRDWPAVATLLDNLQETLGLPLPAVAVDGKAGFQLWLPLAEPVAAESAACFLGALRRQYLGDIADADLALLPMAGGVCTARRIPALYAANERWSAFIDPGMGSMFIDEGGLDFAPNLDRQADLLAAVSLVKAADFERALASLLAAETTPPEPAGNSSTHAAIGGGYNDPREFLLAVMNDAGVPLALRIEAAKGLMP